MAVSVKNETHNSSKVFKLTPSAGERWDSKDQIFCQTQILKLGSRSESQGTGDLAHRLHTGPLLRTLVHSNHACAAKPKVMLQANLCVIHLAVSTFAAELPAQFTALRQPRSAQGMPFGYQSSTKQSCRISNSFGISYGVVNAYLGLITYLPP